MSGFTDREQVAAAQKRMSPEATSPGLSACPEVVTMGMDLEARVPAWFAAKRVSVTPQVLNYWRRSGKITPGEDGLYRLGDVIDVNRRMRTHPNSHRQLCPAR
jgi:hypothetical protein